MARSLVVVLCFLLMVAMCFHVHAGDPTQYLDWTVSYAQKTLFGVTTKVIEINNQFPGPDLVTTTNNVISINVHNNLDEAFLLTWNGIQQRKNSWQDGTQGTNCPIPPGQNWTYVIQAKDQIGSFFYYPTMLFQKASGGFGGITVHNRDVIPVPFATPEDDYTVLIGDWYNADHSVLRKQLDSGVPLQEPDGVLINGGTPLGTKFNVKTGKTYRLRISNVGIKSTLNFRIQGHNMILVETEGSHVQQIYCDSLDVHVGQSYSILVTTDQSPSDYYMVASTRFTSNILTGVAVLHYSNSKKSVSGPYPNGPQPMDYSFSLNQFNSIRWNLTSNAARPNPQGSYHYGLIPTVRTLILENKSPLINGKTRFAVNGCSFIYPDTPLKLADAFEIPGVFSLTGVPDRPKNSGSPHLFTSVVASAYKNNNTEIIFQNNENTMQSWHLDGYSFFVVGMGDGFWKPKSRNSYNLIDAVARTTTQVYPNSWTAILVQFDNRGMWNLRSQHLERQYLGQELYIRVFDPVASTRDELPMPSNAIMCGRANNRKPPT